MRHARTDWTNDTSFDRYARLVRRTVGVPTGLVTIVEPDRQVFPGALGLPEPYQTTRETPLSHSFCQYVVADRRPLVVADARDDVRLRDNLAVRDLEVIAYAGWPLTDADGTVVGSLCAIHAEPHAWTGLELENLEDLAAACSAELAQRQLTGELSASVDELARSNEQLAAFAGQVSHDLRNPLGALAGSLEMLDDLRAVDGIADDSAMAFLLTRARRSTTRMTALVRGVLDFALVGGELDVVDVDVDAVVSAAVEDLHLDLSTTAVTVGALAPVRADVVQLAVVVQNLIGNAAKHAAGSSVEVASEVDGPTWLLTVADHGPGIPSGERERVFETFVRLDAEVTGSGLGLATCRRVARAHGGDVDLAETPGGGTTVRLTLPAAGR